MLKIDKNLKINLTHVVLVDYREVRAKSSMFNKIKYDYRVYLDAEQVKFLKSIDANIRYGSVLSKDDPYITATFPSNYKGSMTPFGYHSNVVLQGSKWKVGSMTGVKFWFVSID